MLLAIFSLRIYFFMIELYEWPFCRAVFTRWLAAVGGPVENLQNICELLVAGC